MRGSAVIRCGISREETLSARRQPRRTNGATGTEIARMLAGIGGSHLNRHFSSGWSERLVDPVSQERHSGWRIENASVAP